MRRAAALCLLLPLVAGCGGSSSSPPHVTRADAQPLIDLAARIAAEGACAQQRDIGRLRRRAVALVDAHRVPAALQEHLMSGVNALVADEPPCVQPPPAAPAAAPPPAPGPHPPHGHGHGRHGHGHHDDRGEGD
jgi:hypothetical protein